MKSLRTVGISLVLVLGLGFVLAACGGDDDGNGNGNGNGDTISIDMPSMSYVPDSVTIDAGTDYTFEISNSDNQMHTFTIDELDVDVEVDPGDTESTTLNVPDSGEYTFYCTVPGHREAGQEGTLTVN